AVELRIWTAEPVGVMDEFVGNHTADHVVRNRWVLKVGGDSNNRALLDRAVGVPHWFSTPLNRPQARCCLLAKLDADVIRLRDVRKIAVPQLRQLLLKPLVVTLDYHELSILCSENLINQIAV